MRGGKKAGFDRAGPATGMVTVSQAASGFADVTFHQLLALAGQVIEVHFPMAGAIGFGGPASVVAGALYGGNPVLNGDVTLAREEGPELWLIVGGDVRP